MNGLIHLRLMKQIPKFKMVKCVVFGRWLFVEQIIYTLLLLELTRLLLSCQCYRWCVCVPELCITEVYVQVEV